MAAPISLPEPDTTSRDNYQQRDFPRVAKWLPAAAKAYRARWRGKGWTC